MTRHGRIPHAPPPSDDATPDGTPTTGEQAGNTPPEPSAGVAAQLPVWGSVDLAIERELADRSLSYAMLTIVDRALPDVRDGLKPSQRRILMAMTDLNLRPHENDTRHRLKPSRRWAVEFANSSDLIVLGVTHSSPGTHPRS